MPTHFATDDAVAIAVDTKNAHAAGEGVRDRRVPLPRREAEGSRMRPSTSTASSSRTSNRLSPTTSRRCAACAARSDLPMLKEPGTWVVEFVGNGISSRAVIRKGEPARRRSRERRRPAVQRVRRIRQRVRDAVCGSAVATTRPTNGEILLPFTTAPGEHTPGAAPGQTARRSCGLRTAPRATQLAAPAHVEREAFGCRPARAHPGAAAAAPRRARRLAEAACEPGADDRRHRPRRPCHDAGSARPPARRRT